MFLLNAQEALGLSYESVLESSLALVLSMFDEYGYKWRERNREELVDEKGEFEWIELPSWDNPSETVRMKKYKDVGSFM